MGALAFATDPRHNDVNKSLTLFTDSKSTLDILRRWTRGDFAPRPEDERHWDILQCLLANIRASKAGTTFIWVKAHSGDPCNEMADVYANVGTESDDVRWD
eukprot:1842707-Rhodomonas_salina.1